MKFGIIYLAEHPIILFSRTTIERLNYQLRKFVKANNLANQQPMSKFANELETLGLDSDFFLYIDRLFRNKNDYKILMEFLSIALNNMKTKPEFKEKNAMKDLIKKLKSYSKTF